MNPKVGAGETAPEVIPATPAIAPRILCVDDEPSILSALKRLFRPDGYTIFTATSGAEGLALLEKEPVDLIISDMRMPEMNGAQFLEKVFERWPDTKRLLLTGYADASSTIAAINQGKIFRYISKPWNDDELIITVRQSLSHRNLMRENARLEKLTREQNAELKVLNASLEEKVAERTAELQAANKELHQSFLATVRMFTTLIEMREGRLAGHSRRTADLARRLAEKLGLEEAQQRDVLLASLLHDIGKIGLPDSLITRPFNALSPKDKTKVMEHPAKGQKLLAGIDQLKQASRIIRHHHELMDGTGYPDQLGGLMIPLGARILSVANDYDALQMGSLALHAHSPKEALEAIIKGRGRRYDPTVVDAFVTMMTETLSPNEPEFLVTPEELRPGMMLTRDLHHQDGHLLLPKGRIIDPAAIAQLRELKETEPYPITLHIRRGTGPATLRDKANEAPPRLFREVALSPDKLKEGMMLGRHLHHHDGYLLLARGNHLDAAIIQQLREIEKSGGHPLTVYIRMDDHS
jgi:response regulator RpfG family c-di-GMP phosphodiesterase